MRRRELARIGDLLAEATPEWSTQRDLEGRARLIAAVDALHRPRWRSWLAAGGALVAAAAIIFLVVARRAEPSPVAFRVENGVPGVHSWVGAPEDAPATVHFSDGSTVTLAPGSRSRVAGTTADGAEVVLEDGEAKVHVHHRDRTKWMIDAGPFVVHVTGTTFVVAWSAQRQALDVWMNEGRVEVSGPLSSAPVSLGAGEHLHAGLSDRTVRVDTAPFVDRSLRDADEARPASSDAGAALDSPGDAPEPPASADSSPDRERPKAKPPVTARPSWTQLVSAGDSKRVLAEAQAEGEAHALATRSVTDVHALGDAARYAGRTALAKQAYAALRKRFPTSAEARTAAFLLGRIAEEQEGAPAAAIDWYDTYLREAPSGPFASNALGRKMVLVARRSGPEAASPIAKEYLQRSPTGPYAETARSLAR